MSERQRKMATGHASTLRKKVSVPGRLGLGVELWGKRWGYIGLGEG